MMREEDHINRISSWEDQLPSPEELTPLTQTLITPNLAKAFDININRNPSSNPPLPPPSSFDININRNPSSNPPLPPPSSFDININRNPFSNPPLPPPSSFDININRNPSSNPPLPPPSSEFIDSGRLDEQAPPVKRPRLVWTPELHKQFLDALTHLGMENAVPKKILQHMRVDGLTRQNVSSHLQKYRLFLKRLRGLLRGEGGNASLDHLSASMPVPHHFLDQDGGPSFQGEGGENYLPSMPPGNHLMAAIAVETPAQQQQHQPGDD